MAGFFETLMAYPNTSSRSLPETYAVFGDAATTPGIVSVSNNNINALQNMVNQARSNLAAAQQGYNNLAAHQPQQYITQNKDWGVWNDSGTKNKNGSVSPEYTNWQTQLGNQQAAINNQQTALAKYQTELQDAINRQQSQIAAGQDAVNWGLAAKNAEQQGLFNAMQAYQQQMANAGARNAIMNAAIGTVGNNGGGQ